MVPRSDDVPPARATTWPGRAAVWLLGSLWLAVQGLGRAGLRLLAAVDAGTSAVARAGGGAVRAALRALGPAGRWLRRVLAPVLRGLRRAWTWLNRRVFLAMARGLGRVGRRVVRWARPAVAAVSAAARRWMVRAEPVMRRLASLAAAVGRAAARLGRSLARVLAPGVSAAAALRRRARSVWAPVAARLRARG
jgi:hypothetical protein